MANKKFQRIGSKSNAHVGRVFEDLAISIFENSNINVSRDYPLDIGIAGRKKKHVFDLGAKEPPIIVECKSHKWTSSGNMPSAKMTVWNEAMYYFQCAPKTYRKIFVVLHDKRITTGESLVEYYIRTYFHLIPPDVEIWEINDKTRSVSIVNK